MYVCIYIYIYIYTYIHIHTHATLRLCLSLYIHSLGLSVDNDKFMQKPNFNNECKTALFKMLNKIPFQKAYRIPPLYDFTGILFLLCLQGEARGR